MKKRVLALLSAVLLLLPLIGAFPALADGDGIDTEPSKEANLALGKSAYANESAKSASKVTDGDPDTYWSATGIPLYAEVDLNANCKIDRIVVRLPLKETNARSYEYSFNVYGSKDGVNFDRLGAMTRPEKCTEEGFVFEVDSDTTYRVIRAMSTMCTKGSYSTTVISEIEVYGTPDNSPVTPTRDKIEISSYDEWLLENEGVDLSKIKDENGKYDIADTYTKEDTVKALNGLVSRILGSEYVNWFDFEIGKESKTGLDYYEISDADGKIHIKGNKGVSIAAGLNYYLKYFCCVNVSQETKQVKMPSAVVPVGETIRTECPYEVRYTYNYCTLSYTMPYYGYDEWQRELDYLMLSGINVVLDTTATEALWVLYLQNYGYSAQEALEFVCGYTWKAWWLMGNLESYGGPVSDTWLYDTVELARVNQRYLAVMGADPCLQAFTGTLPTDFAAKAGKTLQAQGFEAISPYMTATGSWSGFTRPYALNTTYPGFDSLAKKFYETQEQIYGRIGDYYAGDFLHEISSSFNLSAAFNKADMSRTVLDKVIEENDKGVWIIQSWWENPLPEVVAGWGEDREDHMLLLDLAAVQSPRWSNQNEDKYGGLEFGGSSWCYCILEDYGGRDGAHMNLSTMARNMTQAKRKAKHMKGIGLTSEGTERNPVVFDLFWEQGWSLTTINAANWIEKYAERRYGGTGACEAWKALLKNLYGTNTYDGTTINYAICAYPKFDYTGGYYYPSYGRTSFDAALSALIDCHDSYVNEETYVYDLVELLSTELANEATILLQKSGQAAQKGDYDAFHAAKTKYLQTIALMDELNAFTENQTLGKWVGRVDIWVNDVRTGKYSDFDIDLMKFDAVTLITNWSTIDLGNYACRLLSGLLSEYYYRMWNTYMTKAEELIKGGSKIAKLDDRLGISPTVTYYNYGRELVLDVMNGTPFPMEVSPVKGTPYTRSFKEVMEEIRTRFFSGSPVTLNSASLIDGATLTLEGRTLSGNVPGLTSIDVASQFITTEGGSVGFLDPDSGLPIEYYDTVTEGMKAVIIEDDGSVLDCLGFTVGKITVTAEKAAKNAENVKAAEKLYADLSKTDTADFTAFAKRQINQFLEDCTLGISKNCTSLVSYSLDAADYIKELIAGEQTRIANEKKEKKEEFTGILSDLDAHKTGNAELSARLSETSDRVNALDKTSALSMYNAVGKEVNELRKAVNKALVNDPIDEPTVTPTDEPTEEPTEQPTVTPTEKPDEEPTAADETETSSSEDEEKTPVGKTPVGLIVGIACGAAVVVAAVVIFLVLKKKKK